MRLHAVWGCGPVGQFAIWSAWALGAGRVIAIDRVPERLEMARTTNKAETIDFSKEEVYERVQEMTQGRGQTHMHRYMAPLLKVIEDGKIDPSFVITHRVPLEKGPEAYATFRDKKDGCIKVVLLPQSS